MPVSIKTDKSGANTASVRGLVADSGRAIELRQSEYLNNLVEQDHRARTRLNCEPFGSEQTVNALEAKT